MPDDDCWNCKRGGYWEPYLGWWCCWCDVGWGTEISQEHLDQIEKRESMLEMEYAYPLSGHAVYAIISLVDHTRTYAPTP